MDNQIKHKTNMERQNKISTVLNEGVKVRFKAVRTNFFTRIGLIVELNTSI